jgi:hypothetical protein
MTRHLKYPFGLAVLVALPWAAISAQVIDEGVFSIRRSGTEIGREEFTIRSGRGPDGKTAGTTIAAVTRYPALNTTTTITTVLERNINGRFTVFQLEYDAPGRSEQYLGAQDRGRITIHRFSAAAREARQLPGGHAAYVMMDSVYSLHQVLADLATMEGSAVTVYLAQAETRHQITATRSGDNHVQLDGDFVATILLDSANRIMRMEFPGTSVTAVRLDD